MARLLAFTTAADDVEALHPVAEDLGAALHAEVVLQALPEDPDARIAEVLRALESPGVVLGVIPYPTGETAARVAEVLLCCPKPVVLVRTGEAPRRTRRLSRVLVPLDGTDESAAAVGGALALFSASGLDLVVLHVMQQGSMPRFWDQPVHARQSWESEFLARFCPEPGARLELRRGVPGQGILDVADSEQADLIALGWSQPSNRGRARTVWATVTGARVPVMLIPVLPDPATSPTPATAVAEGGRR